MMLPKFRNSREDYRVIAKIAHRAIDSFPWVDAKPLDWMMDVSATHATCPLRLNDLLTADDFNFAHDLGGIRRHLNRETGQLEDCFLPRYARLP